jgi:hypothetical protein
MLPECLLAVLAVVCAAWMKGKGMVGGEVVVLVPIVHGMAAAVAGAQQMVLPWALLSILVIMSYAREAEAE